MVEDTGPVACTEEAKICADGSAVGRTGPNCEFAACPATATSTGGSTLPYTSGVRGTVMLGPTCPVERDPPDPKCADRPYATSISVYRAVMNNPEQAGTLVTTGRSDAEGKFAFSLSPGDYVLRARGGQVMPSCSDTPVSVPAGAYATITISCDSGIR